MSTTIGIQSFQADDYLPAGISTLTPLQQDSPLGRESPGKLTQELLQFTSQEFKSPTNPLDAPSFFSAGKSPPKRRRKANQRKEPSFLISGASSRNKSVLDVKIRPAQRPTTRGSETAVSVYKAIRSVSSTPDVDSVDAFRSGRNVLNRYFSQSRRSQREGMRVGELRSKVAEVRTQSQSRCSLRQQDRVTYLSYLADQCRMQKMHSELDLQRQRFLLSQETRNQKTLATKRRINPRPTLSVKTFDLDVSTHTNTPTFSFEDLKALLMGRVRRRFR